MLENLNLSSEILAGVLVGTLGLVLVLSMRISALPSRSNRSLVLFRQQENQLRSLRQRVQELEPSDDERRAALQ